MIDWTNNEEKISKYFTVGEALYLPTWKIHHIPSEEEKVNILKLASKIDEIREFIDKPIIVHAWIRPISVNCPGSEFHGKNYNLAVGSTATKSGHITGEAVDFHFKGLETGYQCNDVRKKLIPLLNKLNIRMENNKNGSWIHIDIKPVITNRFFNP